MIPFPFNVESSSNILVSIFPQNNDKNEEKAILASYRFLGFPL